MTQEQQRREMFPAFISALGCVDLGVPVPELKDFYLKRLLESYSGGVSKKQVVISFMKWMHGFNLSNVQQDFQNLHGEMDEAAEALQQQDDQAFLLELADIVIYCYGIAQMLETDLDTVVQDKMRYNLQREYDK